jgi:rhodanese-related sulfurtransferase
MIQKASWVLAVTLVAALGLCGCANVPSRSSPASPTMIAYDDPDQLQLLISKKTEAYYLVDVRTIDEYERGHIPTAINIPYDTIADNAPTPYKSTLIIVYCASGARSAKAKQALEKLGYLRVVDFGALSRWKGSSITGGDPGECPCRTQ